MIPKLNLLVAGMLLAAVKAGFSQSTPTGFMAAPGDAQVTLSWDMVPNASTYKVKQLSPPGVDLTVLASNPPRLSLVVTNLLNGRSYAFAVCSVEDSFQSSYSASLSATPSAAVLDLLPAGAKIEKLAGGFLWAEGPVWVPTDGGFLVFSDVNGNQMYRWTPGSGVSTFRKPSNQTNGNTRDREGRLISCQQTTRSVTRTEPDGTITTLVTEYNGKKFNEPNDVVVKSDGSIWFTDPAISGSQTQPGNYVYRFDPNIGNASVKPMVTDLGLPNGLCFSPDESRLYVSDVGGMQTRVYDVLTNNSLTNSRLFASHESDGMRVDATGRLFTTGYAFKIHGPDGKLLATLGVPESWIANVCFGGPNQDMLFITASTSLYGITRLPDLVVTAVLPFPTSLIDGQPTLLSAVVKNQGTGATQAGAPIRVAIAIDDATNFVVATGFNQAIPPGASVVLPANAGVAGVLWTAAAGVHNLRTSVDPSDLLRESNELNNVLTNRLTVAVRPADTDGDGMDDPSEVIAGTNPANPTSVLKILAIERGIGDSVVVTWASVPAKTYRIARKTSLEDFGWAESSEVITATGAATSWTNRTGIRVGSTTFLRVRVEP